MRKGIIGLFTAVLIAAVTYTACNRKKDSIGPTYYVAPEGFEVLSFDVPDKSIDFVTEKCTVNAVLSSQVSWTLSFTGLNSGAVRTYSGATAVIDANTVLWNGTHEPGFFFRKDEKVKIELTFFGSSIKKLDTVTIAVPRNFADYSNNMLLVNSANNGYETFPVGNTVNVFPGQFSFYSTGCTGVKKVTDSISAIEGYHSFILKAKSCDPDGYFIGAIQHRKAGFYFPAWTDPSQVYFNIFVYGVGDPNAKMNMEFHEADAVNEDSKPLVCGPDNIQKGQHSPCIDDGWVYQADISHTGWKLISVRYSDMNRSASPTNGGSGDGLKEPGRVHRIQIGIVSSPPGKTITAIWDFPVITYGAPFDPTK